MTKPAAFQATIHGFRTVPSRGVVSITIEAPIEHHAEIARIAVHGAWVAVARLQQPKEVPSKAAHQSSPPTPPTDGQPERGKMDWKDVQPAAQAGIRCSEPIFAAFLKEQHCPEWDKSGWDAAACVRQICGVASRSELSTNHKARVIWHQLSGQYDAWLALERAS